MKRRKKTKPRKPELRVNHRIRIPQVQVIADDGSPLGTMKTADALRLAQEKEMDLVEVSPYEQPPIAKIMDYGKYKYQKSKETKEARAQGKGFKQETKAVRVGFKTGEHDKAFKAKKADEFLMEGHIVKVELTLRGREKAFAELGKKKLIEFIEQLETPIIPQSQPQRSPFGWIQLITRDKKAPLKKNSIEANDNEKSEKQESAPQARKDNGNREGSEA